MSVHIEFSAGRADFPLGRVFEHIQTARIDLEQLVPTQSAFVPSFWIHSGEGVDLEPDAVQEVLEADDAIRRVRVQDAADGDALIRVAWTEEASLDGLLGAIVEQDATVLEAAGTAQQWCFHLRVPDSAAASRFQQGCRDAGIALDISRVEALVGPTTESTLTAPQREVLDAAFEGGYFAVPRETTLVELADRFDISDQAVSERLRRALVKSVRSELAR